MPWERASGMGRRGGQAGNLRNLWKGAFHDEHHPGTGNGAKGTGGNRGHAGARGHRPGGARRSDAGGGRFAHAAIGNRQTEACGREGIEKRGKTAVAAEPVDAARTGADRRAGGARGPRAAGRASACRGAGAGLGAPAQGNVPRGDRIAPSRNPAADAPADHPPPVDAGGHLLPAGGPVWRTAFARPAASGPGVLAGRSAAANARPAARADVVPAAAGPWPRAVASVDGAFTGARGVRRNGGSRPGERAEARCGSGASAIGGMHGRMWVRRWCRGLCGRGGRDRARAGSWLGGRRCGSRRPWT